jgi:hypothetical protein
MKAPKHRTVDDSPAIEPTVEADDSIEKDSFFDEDDAALFNDPATDLMSPNMITIYDDVQSMSIMAGLESMAGDDKHAKQKAENRMKICDSILQRLRVEAAEMYQEVYRSRAASARHMRTSRHPHSKIINQIITSIATNWKPGPNVHRPITLNGMAVDILPDVQEMLRKILEDDASTPDGQDGRSHIGASALINRLRKLGFPTEEQIRL